MSEQSGKFRERLHHSWNDWLNVANQVDFVRKEVRRVGGQRYLGEYLHSLIYSPYTVERRSPEYWQLQILSDDERAVVARLNTLVDQGNLLLEKIRQIGAAFPTVQRPGTDPETPKQAVIVPGQTEIFEAIEDFKEVAEAACSLIYGRPTSFFRELW